MGSRVAVVAGVSACLAFAGSAPAAPPPKDEHLHGTTEIADSPGAAIGSDGGGLYGPRESLTRLANMADPTVSDFLGFYSGERSVKLSFLGDDPATAAPEVTTTVTCDGFNAFTFRSDSTPDWYAAGAPARGYAFLRCGTGKTWWRPAYLVHFPGDAGSTPVREECVTVTRGADTPSGGRTYTVAASGCPAAFFYVPSSSPPAPAQSLGTKPASFSMTMRFEAA